MTRRREERGSASVIAASVLVVLLVLAMGAADVAKVLVGVGRAQTAADAAALAAAQEQVAPSGRDPADLAADFARRNGAQLEECDCPAGGTEAGVSVSLRVSGLLLFGGTRVIHGRARAVVDWAGAG